MIRHLTVRWRLTLWYTGVLAVVLMGFGAAIYFTMRHQLMGRIDDGLVEELADVMSEVDRATDRAGMLDWLDRRFADHEGFDFQIVTEGGDRIFSNPRLGERRLAIPEHVTPTPRFDRTNAKGGNRYRVISRRAQGPQSTLTVQVARSLAGYDHEMSELLAVLLLIGSASPPQPRTTLNAVTDTCSWRIGRRPHRTLKMRIA